MASMKMVTTDCKLSAANLHKEWNPNTVDHPTESKYLVGYDASEDKLFDTMRYELNRFNSFNGKWPLDFIKPKDMSEAGFFYLQTEDKVQCPFCHVVVDNWVVDDKPLREHMKKSPKCPFLACSDAGNIPTYRHEQPHSSRTCSEAVHRPLYSSPAPYKPKHPGLADGKMRVKTYRVWPVKWLTPAQLADCGLFYTGVSDVVTCYFCGGSLGNWEVDDDPWIEHAKFFPDCAYLELAKRTLNKPSQKTLSTAGNFSKQDRTSSINFHNKKDELSSEIIEQALEIFPKNLVLEVASRRMRQSGKIASLQSLCDEILEYKEHNESSSKLQASEKITNGLLKNSLPSEQLVENSMSAAKRDALLCKICMDNEMGVVFQPCGHLVACPNCAREIMTCPLCRKPITYTLRTYLS